MKEIRAILFDVDGTLLNTSEYIYQSFEQTFRVNGFPALTRAEISRVIGLPLKDCYRVLTGEEGDTIERLASAHHAFQLEHSGLSIPFPHVPETLARLKEMGFKLAAVTNRRSKTAGQTLSGAGLDQFLETVVCMDQVEKPKPDPEHLLKALEIIGESPTHAVIVGDSHIDIEAGKNTGTKTVFVTYGFHASLPATLVPDATIGDIRELPSFLT